MAFGLGVEKSRESIVASTGTKASAMKRAGIPNWRLVNINAKSASPDTIDNTLSHLKRPFNVMEKNSLINAAIINMNRAAYR